MTVTRAPVDPPLAHLPTPRATASAPSLIWLPGLQVERNLKGEIVHGRRVEAGAILRWPTGRGSQIGRAIVVADGTHPRRCRWYTTLLSGTHRASLDREDEITEA